MKTKEKLTAFVVVDTAPEDCTCDSFIYVTCVKQFAHDHINESIDMGIESADNWVVREFREV